jgi:hypothetical protein
MMPAGVLHCLAAALLLAARCAEALVTRTPLAPEWAAHPADLVAELRIPLTDRLIGVGSAEHALAAHKAARSAVLAARSSPTAAQHASEAQARPHARLARAGHRRALLWGGPVAGGTSTAAPAAGPDRAGGLTAPPIEPAGPLAGPDDLAGVEGPASAAPLPPARVTSIIENQRAVMLSEVCPAYSSKAPFRCKLPTLTAKLGSSNAVRFTSGISHATDAAQIYILTEA